MGIDPAVLLDSLATLTGSFGVATGNMAAAMPGMNPQAGLAAAASSQGMIAQAQKNRQIRELEKRIKEEEEKKKKKGLGGILGTGVGALAALAGPVSGGLSLAAGAGLGGAAGKALSGGDIREVLGSGLGGYSAGKLAGALSASDMGKSLLGSRLSDMLSEKGTTLEELKKALDLQMDFAGDMATPGFPKM